MTGGASRRRVSPTASRSSVRVPASSANLGPGLRLDRLGPGGVGRATSVAARRGSGLAIDVAGQGADQVPRDERHLVVPLPVAWAGARSGTPYLPACQLRCRNRVPHGRGLGARRPPPSPDSPSRMPWTLRRGDSHCWPGRHAAGGPRLRRSSWPAQAEGHPDNARRACYGGMTVSWSDDVRRRVGRAHGPDRPYIQRSSRSSSFRTSSCRRRRPGRHCPPRSRSTSASLNAGRAALLVEAMTRRPDLLLAATRDWLHQEQRRIAYPATMRVVDGLRTRGFAAVVSGAGPTVMVLATTGTSQRRSGRRARGRGRRTDPLGDRHAGHPDTGGDRAAEPLIGPADTTRVGVRAPDVLHSTCSTGKRISTTGRTPPVDGAREQADGRSGIPFRRTPKIRRLVPDVVRRDARPHCRVGGKHTSALRGFHANRRPTTGSPRRGPHDEGRTFVTDTTELTLPAEAPKRRGLTDHAAGRAPDPGPGYGRHRHVGDAQGRPHPRHQGTPGRFQPRGRQPAPGPADRWSAPRSTYRSSARRTLPPRRRTPRTTLSPRGLVARPRPAATPDQRTEQRRSSEGGSEASSVAAAGPAEAGPPATTPGRMAPPRAANRTPVRRSGGRTASRAAGPVGSGSATPASRMVVTSSRTGVRTAHSAARASRANVTAQQGQRDRQDGAQGQRQDSQQGQRQGQPAGAARPAAGGQPTVPGRRRRRPRGPPP